MSKREYKTKNQLQNENSEKENQVVANNTEQQEIKNEVQAVTAQNFSLIFTDIAETRRKAVSKEAQNVYLKYKDEIEAKSGRVQTLSIENVLCKPLFDETVYNAEYDDTMLISVSNFYWDRIADIFNKGIFYVPTIQQFCRMLNISHKTLKEYDKHPNERVRNAVEMIKDRFVSFYTEKSMKKEMSEILSIFTLKSTYGLRDNDPPNYFVANNRYTIQADEVKKINQDIDDKVKTLIIEGEVVNSKV